MIPGSYFCCWISTGGRLACASLAGGALSLLCASTAPALEIDTRSPVKLRWDTSAKYSAAWRVKKRSDVLIANINGDDGDRNFRRGFISNRFDLFSELDATYGDSGVRVSGAAWYDTVYHAGNDNDSPATANPYTVPHDQFTGATTRLHGEKAEFLDAFAFTTVKPGGVPVSLRLGRHTLLWGESLLLAFNGISYAQAPLDFIKGLSVPGTQAKELFLPVGQFSVQVRPTETLSFAGYYQLEWRKTRIPAAGSFFSSADILDAGGERLLTDTSGSALFRAADLQPSTLGQWGISTRYRAQGIDTDFGLYYIRFHEKFPQLYLAAGSGADAAIGKVGEYLLVYPEDVELIGASFATTVAEVSLAGEVHGRRNTPLASLPGMVQPGVPADNRDHPLYAVGDTVHAQVSAIYTMPQWYLWGSATILAEAGWQHLVGITRNPQNFDPDRRRNAWGFQTVFTPTYYQVARDLDLNVPLTLSYTPQGKSPLPIFNGPHKGGVASAGVSAIYRTVWNAGVQFNHFYGPSKYQTLKDRDFVTLAVQRTF